MESYFDISNDLKDVWDADIDPVSPEMQDVLDEDSDMSDWLVERESKSGVVLHDRLMTDALGAVPIKTEHSYSLHSDGESAPPSPHHTKVDDMEDECYPAIPASAWRSRRRSSSPLVKAEPKSEPDSPASSCPPSPAPTPTPTSASLTHLDYVIDHTTGTIHMPQAVLQQVGAGSTGTLVLTEEEKRTLLAEGYPVPTRLPLTKAEEKSLKKIRRKIKNKISAQESRRKKKEYMDQLERKVEILVSENSDYRKRVETLEQKNASLLSQLAALQALVTRSARK
ncbi:PREDICTED: cyclic AMP response element-binding protein A-like [Papilio polytes]|uniref:cyclic AMP response element-binding protein A-like n=1 Tax=Papilio polytes TaxID=76194 RepID=UPI000675D0CE|nr:PREDICTED: cyclic AMP response element-binding protein A-like [Papilio polytes]